MYVCMQLTTRDLRKICICMHIYICICMHVCICICTYMLCLFLCDVHFLSYVCIRRYMYMLCIFQCNAYLSSNVYMFKCAYIYKYTYTFKCCMYHTPRCLICARKSPKLRRSEPVLTNRCAVNTHCSTLRHTAAECNTRCNALPPMWSCRSWR